MRYCNTYSIPEKIVQNVSAITASCENITDLPIEKIEDFKEDIVRYLDTTSAHDALDNEDGMICVKFETSDSLSEAGKMVLSAALFHLVNSSVYSPAPEPKNGLPYTTFKSSAKNPEKMRQAGIKFYTPDEKLGYHNDVFFQSGNFFIPKYVSLTNLFIGYEAPGNFYYINQKMWKDFEYFYNKSLNKKFKFRPTPVVYESALNNDSTKSGMEEWRDVPLFWSNETGQKYAFSNGELADNDEIGIVAELKKSLIENSEKLMIPQNLNQIMIFRNDIGFHSRDIFKEQKVFEGTTRLFLRAVSEQSVDLPLQ